MVKVGGLPHRLLSIWSVQESSPQKGRVPSPWLAPLDMGAALGLPWVQSSWQSCALQDWDKADTTHHFGNFFRSAWKRRSWGWGVSEKKRWEMRFRQLWSGGGKRDGGGRGWWKAGAGGRRLHGRALLNSGRAPTLDCLGAQHPSLPREAVTRWRNNPARFNHLRTPRSGDFQGYFFFFFMS